MKAGWTFTGERKGAIPLPPEYTFPQALNYLNPGTNSFYNLESPSGDYLQPGGSKERCTVEHRVLRAVGYDHFILGQRGGNDHWTTIEMSQGEVTVAGKEVFRHWDAIELFKRFFAGEPFPENIVRRKAGL